MQSSAKHIPKQVIIEMICPSDVPAFSKTDHDLIVLLTNLHEVSTATTNISYLYLENNNKIIIISNYLYRI